MRIIYEVGLRSGSEYIDDSVLEIENIKDASDYYDYLNFCLSNGKYNSIYQAYKIEIELIESGDLNIDEMKIKDALSKLSNEEKTLLGLDGISI
jgi:hypothetical protein